MRARIHINLLLAFLFILSGCSSKPGVVVKNFDFAENLTPSSWEKIAVLPFSGDPKFRRTSPEWFSFYLQKQQRYTIITPTYAEIEILNQGMSIPEKEFSIEEARQAGRLLGADAVFTGNIETQKKSQSPVELSLKLIDVKTGKTMATHTIGYPSWVFLWDTFEEYVKLATETAGRDFLVVLKGFAEGKQTEPLPENALPDTSGESNGT